MESLEDEFNLKVVLQELKKFPHGVEDNENGEELKSFLFGRKLSSSDGKCGLSILEKILMTPKATELITFVWKTFKLYRKEEILKMVSF